MAVAALQAADEYYKESKKLCEAFNAASPLSRLSFVFLFTHFYVFIILYVLRKQGLAFFKNLLYQQLDVMYMFSK